VVKAKTLAFDENLDNAPKVVDFPIYAVRVTPMRWLPYKRGYTGPEKGRWQIWNGYGFENVDSKEIDGWTSFAEESK
jgi:hypothetical protein